MLIACSARKITNEDRALKSVHEYLNSHLNDPKSYESVEFELDSNRSTYDVVNVAAKYRLDDYRTKRLMISDTSSKLYKETDSIYRALTLESYKIVLDTTVEYWSVRHKYRAKNAMGALILSHDVFMLDKKFKVLRVIDGN